MNELVLPDGDFEFKFRETNFWNDFDRVPGVMVNIDGKDKFIFSVSECEQIVDWFNEFLVLQNSKSYGGL